jgi:hypothetical protein
LSTVAATTRSETTSHNFLAIGQLAFIIIHLL